MKLFRPQGSHRTPSALGKIFPTSGQISSMGILTESLHTISLPTMRRRSNGGKWTEWGDRFVSDVIEPVYFRLANDISWNIYWISVLREEELQKVDSRQRIVFTSNTEYTKNLLLSLEHLSDAIPIGRISVDTTGEELQQPSDIWVTHLEDKGLSFCLDEYTKKNLDAYLNGKIESRRVEETSRKIVTNQHITKLCAISIPKEFRPHCYPKDWSIPFQSVNLLYGLNGSEKPRYFQQLSWP